MKGKKILLGVTGSIAAYKAAEIVRLFVKAGAEVKVVMTESAAKFISPLTLRTLSGNRVYDSVFGEVSSFEGRHISLAAESDILLIAPATANTIGKLSHGLADDLLATIALAIKKPIVIAPAMNDAMYENPVMQDNVRLLMDRGVKFIEPAVGKLASGKTGKGRLASPELIFDEVEAMLSCKDFKGQTVIVSAGPTREPIDPIRFISNPSTGNMGYAVAKACRERGAEVILVTGPTSIQPPSGVEIVNVETADEMRAAILRHFDKSTVVIMSAAVANYRPKTKMPEKVEKGREGFTLSLLKNPDILKELGSGKGEKILVGFSLDTENPVEKAKNKLAEKNLDLIVVSDISAGFGAIETKMKVIGREGNVEELPRLRKEQIAHLILDRLKKLLKNN